MGATGVPMPSATGHVRRNRHTLLFMPNQTLSLGVVAAALSQDPRAVPVRSARRRVFRGCSSTRTPRRSTCRSCPSAGRREFLRLLGAQDQRLVGLPLGRRPKGLRPGTDVDQALARLERVLEAAAGLQSPLCASTWAPYRSPGGVETKAEGDAGAGGSYPPADEQRQRKARRVA
jgi:hypothetical protein